METRQGYTEEVEIDIKQMLIYCIEGAWRILLAGLLCLLLLGGYKFVKSFSAYRSLQGMVQTKLKSEGTDAALYELQRESYLSQIENLKEQLRQRTEYREESPLMKLNADDFYEARLSWFVTTNYQIDPDKTFQNPDRTASVLKSYQSLLASGEFYRYVHERVSAKIPEKYLQELIESDADEQYGLLRLSIFGGEEKLVTEIMQAAEQFLDERKAPIAEVVAAHEISCLSAEVFRSWDADSEDVLPVQASLSERKESIRQKQMQVETGIYELQTQIVELRRQYDALQAPEKFVTLTAVGKSSLKFGLLGFLLGAFLAAGYRALRFLLTNPLVEEGEVMRRLGIVVLGSKRRYPAQGILNRINAALSGDEARQRTEEETCGFAAENLRSLLEISPEAEASGILLLGTDEALVKDVYEKINAGWEGEKLGFTGNILYSTAAVERLRDYRRVVLVEEKGKLPFEKLQQECEKLRLLQKEICGIMLL